MWGLIKYLTGEKKNPISPIMLILKSSRVSSPCLKGHQISFRLPFRNCTEIPNTLMDGRGPMFVGRTKKTVAKSVLFFLSIKWIPFGVLSFAVFTGLLIQWRQITCKIQLLGCPLGRMWSSDNVLEASAAKILPLPLILVFPVVVPGAEHVPVGVELTQHLLARVKGWVWKGLLSALVGVKLRAC